jgi:hypothetical protein
MLQLSVDDMMAKCMSDTELDAMRTNMLVLKRYAAAFGLPLVTYEAGPSIVVSMDAQSDCCQWVWA